MEDRFTADYYVTYIRSHNLKCNLLLLYRTGRVKKSKCSSVETAKWVRIRMCIHNMLKLRPPTKERHDKASLTGIPLGPLMIN